MKKMQGFECFGGCCLFLNQMLFGHLPKKHIKKRESKKIRDPEEPSKIGVLCSFCWGVDFQIHGHLRLWSLPM